MNAQARLPCCMPRAQNNLEVPRRLPTSKSFTRKNLRNFVCHSSTDCVWIESETLSMFSHRCHIRTHVRIEPTKGNDDQFCVPKTNRLKKPHGMPPQQKRTLEPLFTKATTGSFMTNLGLGCFANIASQPTQQMMLVSRLMFANFQTAHFAAQLICHSCQPPNQSEW